MDGKRQTGHIVQFARKWAVRIGSTLYFDYQAAPPLDPVVAAAMAGARGDGFANPQSADHALGWRAQGVIDAASATLARWLDVSPATLHWTSGATAANRTAIALGAGTAREGQTLIVGAGDHLSVLDAAYASGLRVLPCPLCADGAPDFDWLAAQDLSSVAMISMIAVSNETGVPTDVARLAAIGAASGVPVHLDAAQAPLAGPMPELAEGIALLTLSAHKLYGPKGIGALYLSEAFQGDMPPSADGILSLGTFGGTLPVDLVHGFAVGVERLQNIGPDERDREARLRDRLVTRLDAAIGAQLVGRREGRHPGNALMFIPGVDGADLLARLQPEIAASSRSACASSADGPSHVLRAMGLGEAEARACVRFSLGRFTYEDQVDEAAVLVSEAVAAIRREDAGCAVPVSRPSVTAR